jgi:hypothetical protein
MPRYGPPPTDEPSGPPPEDDKSSLTRWSLGAKILAVVAGFGMVAAFVFEFLPPTSSGPKKISTTVVVTSTTLSTSTAALPSTTTSAPASTSTPASSTTAP